MEAERMPVLRTAARLLTFRAARDEMLRLDNRHLAFGLMCVWLVGMARAWDNPHAQWLQRLGVGSVIYVFVLSLLLWATVKPLTSPGHSYRQMLAFVCLVSPPGLIYAIPVEMWFQAEVARDINVAFVGVAATWRVALLVFYLRRALVLRPMELIVSTLLPLTIIMVPIFVLRIMASVFEGMSGVRGGHKTPDLAARVLAFLGQASLIAFLPLLMLYMVLVARRVQEKRSGA